MALKIGFTRDPRDSARPDGIATHG